MKPKDSQSSVAVLEEPVGLNAKPAPVENKTYRVIKGQVGPWSEKDSFSFSQFKAVTALPSIKFQTSPGEFSSKTIMPPGLDLETYWEGLIDRLITLQVIRYEPGLVVGEIPLGPEWGPRYATLNSSQTIAMKEAAEMVARQPLTGSVPIGERRAAQRIEPSELGADTLRQV